MKGEEKKGTNVAEKRVERQVESEAQNVVKNGVKMWAKKEVGNLGGKKT